MTTRRPLACLLLLLLAAAAAGCARRTEIIGRLPDGAVDAPADVPPGVEVTDPVEAGQGAGPDVAGLPLCPTPAERPPVSAPSWNCGANCWRSDQVDLSVFNSAPARPPPARPPEVLYPIATSVHPTNLPRITVHWRRALVEQRSFRLRFDGGAGRTFDLYVPYATPANPGGPVDLLDSLFTVPDAIWRYIADQSAGKAVSLTVAAHDSLANVVDVSSPVPIRFAAGPVEGGLHYMTMLVPGRGIQRHLFGTGRVDPLVVPGAEPYNFDCGGCHSISRDGGLLAFAATYEGNLTVAATGRLAQPIVRPGPTPDSSAFAPAVHPRGTFVVARSKLDHSVSVFSAQSGAPVSRRDAAFLQGRIDFPSWSPSGDALVATRTSLEGQPEDQLSARDGELVILRFDGINLGAPTVLLNEGGTYVHSYPSWSPDGQWIVFTSSPAGSETYRNRQTRLRLINPATGSVRDLMNATFGLDKGSKFARFAPTGLDGCKTLFLTFQSGLDYGVLRRGQVEWLQLWMSAIDLSSPASDPSSPPVWLPFQDHEQKNLLPSWSDLVPCGDADCGPEARCDQSRAPARCVPL